MQGNRTYANLSAAGKSSKWDYPNRSPRLRLHGETSRLLSAGQAIRVTSNNTDRQKTDVFRRDTVLYFALIAYYYHYAFYVILINRINSIR